MEKFTTLTSILAPLDIPNVDTDQIIPKQFLKRVERTGFGEFLFYDWRYNNDNTINKEFSLNQDAFKNSSILVTRDNFGCGSSREHAPWALVDFGFRCIIAPSFADIFYNNCFQNSILPIQLDNTIIDKLFNSINKDSQVKFTINLLNQTIESNSIETIKFSIDEAKKKKLLEGLDDIGLTLLFDKEISKYEATNVLF